MTVSEDHPHREEIDQLVAEALSEIYIGDGLYVSFDGYNVKLRAPRPDGDDEVYLEPSVLDALDAYITKLKGIRMQVEHLAQLP